MFEPEELAYLRGQRLARIATVSPRGQPDVAPVGFRLDGDHFVIGGYDNTRTLKYRNVAAGNDRVALVVDDLESVQPWAPRGIKVHGRAELTSAPDGRPLIRVTPERKWSWGILAPAFRDGRPTRNRS